MKILDVLRRVNAVMSRRVPRRVEIVSWMVAFTMIGGWIGCSLLYTLGMRRIFAHEIPQLELPRTIAFAVGGWLIGRLLRKRDASEVQQANGRCAAPIERADWIFGILSALLPRRIVNEEVGDALEDLATRVAKGRPAWEIRLKICATVFWVIVHTAVDFSGKIAKAAGIVDMIKAFRR